MICHLCKEDKLSKEFPFEPLTETCDHPLLHCLDCATASVKNHHRCSQCESEVCEDNEKYQEYLETLDFLFPNLEEHGDGAVADSSYPVVGASSGNVVVTTLSGESATFPYHPSKKIADLKKEIETALKTPSSKQRLLYHDTELKTTNESRQLTTLKDFNVPPNSKLHLIILLCEVPDEFDDVIFDFSWGIPHGQRRDYLDVSVFLYSGRSCLDVIDYRHSYSYSYPGVRHSGPADMYLSRGHQKVNVSLKSIPSSIDNVVFTLSAWGSSNISKYPNPRLNFYDANFPDKLLCNAEMSHAEDCRAIVMCSLSKKGGRWVTVRLKVGSNGFTRNYWPLKMKIEDLIRRGCT